VDQAIDEVVQRVSDMTAAQSQPLAQPHPNDTTEQRVRKSVDNQNQLNRAQGPTMRATKGLQGLRNQPPNAVPDETPPVSRRTRRMARKVVKPIAQIHADSQSSSDEWDSEDEENLLDLLNQVTTATQTRGE
jgi:hypothetical protein